MISLRLLPAALAIALAGNVAPHQVEAASAKPPSPIAAAGTAAPAFTVRTIDGRSVSLADYRGKTLVLNVWATWCPPCREETPELVASYARLQAKNVAFLGIDTTEDASLVRAFAAAKGVPYDEAVDDGHAFERAYDIRYFPTTFIIDPRGIVRERHTDVVGTKQMLAFVTAAAQGRTATISSPMQRRIDALLAPDRYRFFGPPAAIRTAVFAADKAINDADSLGDETDAATGNITDFVRTQREEEALRERAIAAFSPIAHDRKDGALLARMRGDDAVAQERWGDAVTGYEQALRLDPRSADALDGLARAQSARHEDAAALVSLQRLAVLDPSADNEISLALAFARRSEWDRARSAAQAGIQAAERGLRAKPHNAHALRLVAWTHLYAGRIEARSGNRDGARADFAQTTVWAEKLPHNDSRYAMYLEEAQEATVALGLATNGATVVSLTPWTGPDLPGSVASTVKYRLVVAGAAGRNVALTASGLPKHWIASFCSDRLCSPFRVSVVVPSSGVKVVEFQVIPDAPSAQRPTVRIDAEDGGTRTSVAAVVRAT